MVLHDLNCKSALHSSPVFRFHSCVTEGLDAQEQISLYPTQCSNWKNALKDDCIYLCTCSFLKLLYVIKRDTRRSYVECCMDGKNLVLLSGN